MARKKKIQFKPDEVLAKFTISMSDKTLKNVEKLDSSNLEEEAVIYAEEKSDAPNEKYVDSKFDKRIKQIWKDIDSGKIDLTKAIVGYNLDHKMILDYMNIKLILRIAGYNDIEIAFFMNDFYNQSLKLSNAPIIMIDVNSHSILLSSLANIKK